MWQLKRTIQCAKCPWKVTTDPNTIPDGYSIERHQNLKTTIAQEGVINPGALPVMACHAEDEAHCIGWLHHQLGVGNNVVLRIRAITCTNMSQYQIVGEQHPDLESTMPQ